MGQEDGKSDTEHSFERQMAARVIQFILDSYWNSPCCHSLERLWMEFHPGNYVHQKSCSLSQALLKQIPKISSKKTEVAFGEKRNLVRDSTQHLLLCFHHLPAVITKDSPGRKGSDLDSKIITYQIYSLFVHSSTDKNEVRRWMGDEAFKVLNVLVILFTAKKGEKQWTHVYQEIPRTKPSRITENKAALSSPLEPAVTLVCSSCHPSVVALKKEGSRNTLLHQYSDSLLQLKSLTSK